MIKNLVFDLGGVLLDIEFKRTFDAFNALGIRDAYKLNDYPDVLDLFVNFEKGLYTIEGFHKRFRVLTGFDGCKHDLDEAFNALLVGFVPERIARVQDLAVKYKTYILSNTNAIHCMHYNQMLYELTGIKNLDHLVDKAYYSHDLGSRKPDREIYLRMIEDAGILAEESLFIDDRQENLAAAKKIGFKVILVNEKHTFLEALEDL